MSTFKAYLKKEILESIRQYRYLIIGITILFFAISDPLMMKAIPLILKSQQYKGIEAIMPTERNIIMENYLKDVFQLINIVIVFCISGTLGKEIGALKLIFPYSKGCSATGMVLAKFIHNAVTAFIMLSIGIMINYYYVDILFSKGKVEINTIFNCIALMGLFFIFTIALCTFLSSIFKKEAVTGVLALFMTYFLMIFGGLKQIFVYLPVNLFNEANSYLSKSSINEGDIIKTVAATIILIILFIYLTIKRMKKIEVCSDL